MWAMWAMRAGGPRPQCRRGMHRRRGIHRRRDKWCGRENPPHGIAIIAVQRMNIAASPRRRLVFARLVFARLVFATIL
jgi:hypothetical protein